MPLNRSELTRYYREERISVEEAVAEGQKAYWAEAGKADPK
jgi:hypothetical protein